MTDDQGTVPPQEPAPQTSPPLPPTTPPPTEPPTQPPGAPGVPDAPSVSGPGVPPAPPAPGQYAAGQPVGQYAQPQQGYVAQPVYGQPYAPAGYPQYAAPPPQGLSIASMICGIVAVVGSFIYGIGLLPAIAAVVTGHLARKRQPYARGMWLTGLITGYVGIGIALLWIIGGIVVLVIYLGVAASTGFSNS